MLQSTEDCGCFLSFFVVEQDQMWMVVMLMTTTLPSPLSFWP
jgi:hypothetical protein